MSKLDPKCLNEGQPAFGFTNRGEVIPCCWLDTDRNRDNQEYQKLIKVSNIEDYDSVEEIFLNDEWIEFFKNLAKGKGFPQCHSICKKRETPQHKREIFKFEDRIRET